ncbi:MAG: hypothetical protein WCQ87_07810 [Parabacteroides sp.]
MQTTVEVNGSNITLTLFFHYNEVAKYWCMRITDSTGTVLVDSIPLLTGEYPAANLLEQYAYLKIGSAYILKVSKNDLDYPDDNTLGDVFVMVWQ